MRLPKISLKTRALLNNYAAAAVTFSTQGRNDSPAVRNRMKRAKQELYTHLNELETMARKPEKV